MINTTTLLFINELKTKPLDTYSLSELQVELEKCFNMYKRFKKEEDRVPLKAVWIKMATQYNTLLKEKYSNVFDVYLIDALDKL